MYFKAVMTDIPTFKFKVKKDEVCFDKEFAIYKDLIKETPFFQSEDVMGTIYYVLRSWYFSMLYLNTTQRSNGMYEEYFASYNINGCILNAIMQVYS